MSNEAVLEIEKARAAMIEQRIANGDTVANGDITTSSGGAGIDLLGAATLLRLNTPWTDKLARISDGVTGLSAQWYEILTSSGNAGATFGTAAEGNRGGQIDWSGSLRTAAYKSLSRDAFVTDEQIAATKGVVEALNLNMAATLTEVKRAHHMQNLLGRTTGQALTASAPAAPALAATTTGGSVAAATWSVIYIPLNGDAARRLTAYPLNGTWTPSASSGSELADSTRTNGDGTTTTVKGGTGIKSTAATQATTGSTSTLSVTITPIKGAVAYAVFIGVAGSEVFQGVTTQSVNVLTRAIKAGTYACAGLFTADNSVDPLQYDGLLTLLTDSTSPSYYLALTPGSSSLSSGADMCLDQLEGAFAYAFNTFDGYGYKYALMSGNTARAVNKAIMSNAIASRAFVQIGGGENVGALGLGSKVVIRNPYTQELLEVIVDPYMPDGKIVLGTYDIPSQFGGGVQNAVFFRAQREFYGETWPRTRYGWGNGVRLRGALCTPWRAGHAVIDGIAV